MVGVRSRPLVLVLFVALAAGCGAVGTPVDESPPSAGPYLVSALELASGEDEILPGDQLGIVALVRNAGGAEGTYQAQLLVNGAPFGTQHVALAAGETKLVRFTLTVDGPGQYEVRLADELFSFEVAGAADFAVTDLRLVAGGDAIVSGDQLTVRARIENTGDVGGVYQADLTLDGSAYATRDLEVAAESAGSVQFTVEAGLPGLHELRLGDARLTFVVERAVAQFVVSNLVVEPNDVDRGAEVRVTVDVANIGGASGTYLVELLVDGTLAEAREVTLAGGESTIVDFMINADRAGRYTVAVDRLTTELSVWAIERPANGTVLLNEIRGGMGRLTIRNRADRDVLAVVTSASDPSQPVLAVYVRAGKSRTIRQVKDGTYTIFYSLGERWDSGSSSFTINVTYQRSSGELRFKTTKIRGGHRYTIWTVTLDPVDGGTPLYNVGEDGFPSVP